MDKGSRVLWKYLAHAHHDVDVAADGRIYLLTQEVGTDEVPELPGVRPPRIDDYAVVLSPEGRELRKVRLLDALRRSRFARLLDTVPWHAAMGSGDYLHANGIDALDGRAARRLPEAAAGRALLSLRDVSAVAILDLDKGEVVWAALGPWLRQHDPDLLPDGRLLLFDNQGNLGPGGGISRVLELDPATMRIAWSYAGGGGRPLESAFRSSQQRLANGNTLVTEGEGGRLLEVTRAGEVAWEYVNPVRGGDGDGLVPIVAWAQRVDPAGLRPEFLGGAAE
jgi:Arylsulfotransferase (ASST)